MAFLTIARVSIYGLSFLFGIVVLGLSAGFVTPLVQVFGALPQGAAFLGLGIAAGVFNLLTLPILIIVGAIRKKVVNVLELPILGFLIILWLIESILTTQQLGSLQCDILRGEALSLCQRLQAIQGLSFVIWLLLFIYIIITVVFCANGKASWQGEAQKENKGRTTYQYPPSV
ncbi:hypothetical protein Moror_811 [Moniliophthora roreri MCA 2997]|uniref:MARVEL domain-containing protein n=1 Tax=Moniliophthora roreri (strain MCA 2997) TaxID=1381753 RepID=V2XAR0_MONRO|nr:hypothetical protein Moror_811 [Moniliophthora roreri MCA 2997]